MTSPFLAAPASSWIASNALAFALPDGLPVSRGHTLVIPRRAVTTWFDASPEERAAIVALIDDVKRIVDQQHHPDGYTLVIDDGEAAGQTVMHLHVHLIPRYRGDVRHVIPGRGDYPAEAALATGGGDPFLRHLAPLFGRAHEIAIVAAFVLETGLSELEGYLVNALARGAHVRVLTGNYLDITQIGALRRLVAWSVQGRLEARIVDMADRRRPGTTFHPKSWRLEGPDFGVAFVGSSNISRAALGAGVEWNLRVERARDPGAYREVEGAFERLWGPATALTADWIDAYERRLGDAPNPVAAAFTGADEDAPLPHDIQVEALAALAESREQGRRRALVVLATGLGKTWLAAFDAYNYMRDRLGGATPRLLFISHREEILAQAEKTFRRMFHRERPTVGLCAGSRSELDAQFVFASVQKLSRHEGLSAERFDYAIIDEVHHGTASSYTRILDRLDAGFLLGLTATPERTDGADVIGLFDEHVAFRADIGVGILRKLLVPFSYFGLKDAIDYKAIDWKNQRFDPDQLARAVDTQDRMEQMWRAWEARPGTRTIVFCCTIEHADHACAYLAKKGVRARAIHSGPGSAARASALAALQTGEVDALCAVDILNEGVDVPQVDRVVMLRPTESPVVFLQQLGRGLRVAAGKVRLTVLDFIGNHRVFLDRLRLLAALGAQGAQGPSVRDLLGEGTAKEVMPGCPITIELEAKDLLGDLLMHGGGGKTAAERAYLDMTDARGIRPTAGELFRMGYPIKDLRKGDERWFDFVQRRGGLGDAEQRVLAVAKEWLRSLEKTAMNLSFKMVTLEAMIEADKLTEGLPVAELARRSYAILRRSPDLFRDLEGVEGLEDPEAPDEARFLAYWRRRKNPIDAWISGRDGGPWFKVDDHDRFVPIMPIPSGDEETFTAMTRELVDYRLAVYRDAGMRQASVTALPLRRLIAYPSLRAAAGAVSDPVEGEPEPTTLAFRTRARGKGLFAVRATGDSMNGFQRPIRDGDWVILRATPGATCTDLEGKVALCRVPDPGGGQSFQLKRVVRAGDGFVLRSDNLDARPRSYEVTEETRLVAVRVDVVRPEDVWSRQEEMDEEEPPRR